MEPPHGSGFDVSKGISDFSGNYEFLGPYYPIQLMLADDLLFYPTLMHAYVAARTNMATIRERIRQANVSRLSQYNRQLHPASQSWYGDRRKIVFDLLTQKFVRTRWIANRLVTTSPSPLFFISDDRFLGCSLDGKFGENFLGSCMTRIRRLIIKGEFTIGPIALPKTTSEPLPVPRTLSVPEKSGVLLRDDVQQITGKLDLKYFPNASYSGYGFGYD